MLSWLLNRLRQVVAMPPSDIVTWAVELQGDHIDLSQMRNDFKDGDPKVIEEDMDGDGNRAYLRSSQFDGLQDGRAVIALADEMLGRMNGTMLVHHGSKPVKVGPLRTIHRNGGRGVVIMAEPGILTIRGMPMEVLVDGKRQSEPSGPQAWFELAKRDRHVADALRFLASESDWHGLWKAFEELEQSCPGRRKFIWREDVRWSTRDDVNRFAMTAQHYRHANDPLPDRPMTFAEARDWLFGILRRWIDWRLHGLPR